MEMVKGGLIAKNCQANALQTFNEYLENYASSETKEKGLKLISSYQTGA